MRIAIVVDALGANLAEVAARLRSRSFRGPSTLEVVMDRLSGATIGRLIAQLERLGFETNLIHGPRPLAEFAGSRARFPYHGVINLSAGIPAPYRVGQTAILLEMIGVPYSGPDPQGLLVMRDKALCKLIAEKLVVRAPAGLLVTQPQPGLLKELKTDLFPLIVKPNTGSMSIGMSQKIETRSELSDKRISALINRFPDGILIERFIPGLEVTVLRIGNGPQALAVPLILRDSEKNALPSDFVFSTVTKALLSPLFQKAAWFLACDFLSAADHEELIRITHAMADALHVRDLARFDFRISAEDGQPYFIECNGQPSLNHHTGSVVEAVNRLWYGEDAKVEDEFLQAALRRMKLF